MTQQLDKTEYGSSTKTVQRVRTVHDKKGRDWVVIETITSRWYAKAYFDKVLAVDAPEALTEVEQV